MILVVQNSKELDMQRKLFLESMSLAVSIVKPRTSSHQAIAEALDELQVSEWFCPYYYFDRLELGSMLSDFPGGEMQP